ncbi:ABC transporter permease [Saxibacter everestensis]|uniref:ABC transporter permease n=1 Tax=Saxibacter everestensis TaxID=2909229 RepID=A0ABY8QTN4_9MICO|nr:ABC transporter permease [Brevibacteriaceae bacterium ZFBP1038]
MAELGEDGMSSGANTTRKQVLEGHASWNVLIWPALIFMAALFLLPFIQTAVRSLTDPGPENYGIFLSDPIYLRSLLTTFTTAIIVTVVALLIAYPYAYLMYRATPRMAGVLTLLVMLPFFTSLLVRTYAWTVWLQQTGIINSALLNLGIIESPLALMRNTLGVAIGMTHSLLPFMVFPIYASMRRVPPNLMPAARSLGANNPLAFRTVFMPLTTPGIVSGCLIVFVMSLGYYVTPALLGAPDNAMLSELVVNQVEQQIEFGTGSAIGMVLLLVTLIVLFIGTRVVRFKDIVTGGR